jgi:hypothetical protein
MITNTSRHLPRLKGALLNDIGEAVVDVGRTGHHEARIGVCVAQA